MLEAYKVGVEIALADGIYHAIARLGGDLTGIHAKVGEIEKGFGKWTTAIVGVGSALAAAGIISGLKSIAEHGEELLDQQNKMVRAQGAAVGVVEAHRRAVDLTAKAYKDILPQVPTATASEVLRTANELYMVTGSMDSAAAAIPKSLMLEALVGNMTGKDASGQGYNAWRAIELKGASQDEALTDAVMGKITAAIIGSGGKVTGGEFFNFAKFGGAAWMMANDRALSGGIPYAINEMGGARAGTGSLRMYNTIQGSRTWSKQQYEEWDRLGLVDPALVTSDRGGRRNLKPGAVHGALEFGGDLEGFVNQVLRPAFERMHITDPGKVNAELAKLFPDSVGARLAQVYYQQQENIEKDRRNLAGAMPLSGAYGEYLNNDPKGVTAAYEAQKKAMLEAVGAPIMQAAIPIMRQLTDVFHSIGEFANNHPDAIKVVGAGLAGLAVALGALSAVALAGIAAAFVGISGTVVAVAAGLTAIAGAIAALVVINWEAISSGIDTVRKAIASFFGGHNDSSPPAHAPYFGTDPLGAPVIPQSYHPGSIHPELLRGAEWQPSKNNKPIAVTAELNVDGAQMARTMAEQVAQLLENPTMAFANDGMSFADQNGGNPIT